MKPKTASQKGTGSSSKKVNYATGSGSRPKGGTQSTPSSAPANQQKIRS